MATAGTSLPRTPGPVERSLLARVQAALAPTHVAAENESYKHASGPGAESHFKLLVVSASFEGKSVLDRHRLVMDAARGGDAELPCHALSVSAKTPAQWVSGAAMHSTPNCVGGDGSGAKL